MNNSDFQKILQEYEKRHIQEVKALEERKSKQDYGLLLLHVQENLKYIKKFLELKKLMKSLLIFHLLQSKEF